MGGYSTSPLVVRSIMFIGAYEEEEEEEEDEEGLFKANAVN